MEPKKCIECGAELVPKRNRSGLCIGCATKHVLESAKQLKEKKGPYYEKWKARVRASVE